MEEAESLCRRVAIMQRGRVMVVGTPGELKESIEGDTTTMDDVFAHYAKGAAGDEAGSTYQETARARRTAKRLG